jgi:hypothetical protein
MPTENSPGTVTPIKAAAPACKHILLPGDEHCLNCEEQIVFPSVKRTRWQRFTAWLAGCVARPLAEANVKRSPGRRHASRAPTTI